MGLYINGTKMGKPYINGIKHNTYIDGQKIFNESPPILEIPEGAFSITIEGDSFDLPTRGVSGGYTTYQSYNWIIDWGDGQVQPVSGTGSSSSVIAHTYSFNKNYDIIIRPNGEPVQGWLNAFGCSPGYTDASKIKSINTPITNLMRTMTNYAFRMMFYGCKGLTKIPSGLLPATTLASSCYNSMFSGCTGLKNIPSGLLPATTLASSCYSSMFSDCLGLKKISSGLLPATTLASSCYNYMFYGCTGLTSLPDNLLPATTLNDDCYNYMFQNCTGLDSIPDGLLPATTLASSCYYFMFSGCTGLTEIPSGLLPATTLVYNCYDYMFYRCTGLSSLPDNLLPATTLVEQCYSGMFNGCSNLTDIGNMNDSWFSARTTARQPNMFRDCINITTPIIHADIPIGWK
jgi:hypothetical protein